MLLRTPHTQTGLQTYAGTASKIATGTQKKVFHWYILDRQPHLSQPEAKNKKQNLTTDWLHVYAICCTSIFSAHTSLKEQSTYAGN